MSLINNNYYLTYPDTTSFNHSEDYTHYKTSIIAPYYGFLSAIFTYGLYKLIQIHYSDNLKHQNYIKASSKSNYYLQHFEWNYRKDALDDFADFANDQTLIPTPNIDYHNKMIQIVRDLSTNARDASLNYQIILYFIFYKRGTYYISLGNKQIARNAYDEYCERRDDFGGSEYFNLDMSQSNNIELHLTDNEIVYASRAELNFLDWLVASGIWDYTIVNKNIRFTLLEQMTEHGLLRGNDFLYFQIVETEKHNELLNSIEECDMQISSSEDGGEIEIDSTKVKQMRIIIEEMFDVKLPNIGETSSEEESSSEESSSDENSKGESGTEESSSDENSEESGTEESSAVENLQSSNYRQLFDGEGVDDSLPFDERLTNEYVYKAAYNECSRIVQRILKNVKTNLDLFFGADPELQY